MSLSLSRTLWPSNRAAICVAPAQKVPPSIMAASSIYQTLRYFCHGQCIPIQCNAGDPNQKTLLARFLELLDLGARALLHSFQVTKLSSNWCISLTSLITQDAFCLSPFTPPVHLLLSFASLCIDKGKRPTETDMHSGWSGRLVICSNSQFWVDHYMQMVASWWSADWEPKHLWSEDSTRKCWKVWEWQEKVEESAAIWISTEHIWTSLSTDVQLITWWWCRCAEIFTIWIN